MKGRWAVLALVALGTFMTTLDASIVNIGLPSIARTFHTPIGSAVEWVIIAYLVVIAATLLTFGRLSDLVGRKSVWVAGLAIFSLGSIFCGAAGSLRQLIVARRSGRSRARHRPGRGHHVRGDRRAAADIPRGVSGRTDDFGRYRSHRLFAALVRGDERGRLPSGVKVDRYQLQ